MTSKQTIGFRQKTAGFFLLLLCVVSVIKVSHSHPSLLTIDKNVFAAKKSILPAYFQAQTDSKCLICDYQLAKDADASYASFQIISPFKFGAVIALVCSLNLPKAHTVFETRGPPSA